MTSQSGPGLFVTTKTPCPELFVNEGRELETDRQGTAPVLGPTRNTHCSLFARNLFNYTRINKQRDKWASLGLNIEHSRTGESMVSKKSLEKTHEESCCECISGVFYCAERMKIEESLHARKGRQNNRRPSIGKNRSSVAQASISIAK
jgi:hypothetical protein